MEEKMGRNKYPLKKLGIESVKIVDQSLKLEHDPELEVLEDQELRVFLGKARSTVVDYIKKTYPGRVPGPAHLKYLLENPKDIPEAIKDGYRYYLIGCVDRTEVDKQSITGVVWREERLKLALGKLENAWSINERVLLLPKIQPLGN